jgi:hypothetical protein
MTTFDASDGALGPTPLVAMVVHEYDRSFVSPDTTIGLDAADPIPVAPPSEETHDAA